MVTMKQYYAELSVWQIVEKYATGGLLSGRALAFHDMIDDSQMYVFVTGGR